MSIVSVPVRDVTCRKVISGDWPNYIYKEEVCGSPYYNNNDTYMVVFGPTQHYELGIFERNFKGKVLFRGKPACNINHKGSGPRNTLIIFEMEGHSNGDA